MSWFRQAAENILTSLQASVGGGSTVHFLDPNQLQVRDDHGNVCFGVFAEALGREK